jgi:hypothetical protein
MSLFDGLHREAVMLEPWSAEAPTGWKGAGSYGPAQMHRCRIEHRQKRVVDRKGRELLSKGRVIIAGRVHGIDVRARLTLPFGSDPRQPPILAIETSPDPFGLTTSTVLHF